MPRSTATTAYILQPFWRQGRGFRKGDPRRLESKALALRKAEELGAQAGVIVLEMEVDATVDFCGEPRVIASYGEVPEAA